MEDVVAANNSEQQKSFEQEELSNVFEKTQIEY